MKRLHPAGRGTVTARSATAIGVVTAMMSLGCGDIAPAPCGLRVCDIRQAACQQVAAEGAACLRGVAPPSVPVTVIAQAEYIRTAATQVLTPAEQHSEETWNAALAVWGLAPAGLSPADKAATSAAQVGAFYSPQDKGITIVDDGDPLDSRAAMTTLVHEYVHAMQDAAIDLATFTSAFGTDFDSRLGANAVIEGEATMVADTASVGLFGDAGQTIPWDWIFANWRAEGRNAGLNRELPVELAWADFRYPFGTPFTFDAHAQGGWGAVDALRASPPTSARQVIAGYGRSAPPGGNWVEPLGADAVAVLPTTFSYFDSDRMGTWIFDLYVGRARPKQAPPAYGLQGDLLSVYEEEATGAVASVWRLRFSSAAEAAGIAASLRTSQGMPKSAQPFRLVVLDRDLVLVSAARPAVLEAIPVDLTFQAAPPKMEPPTSAAATAPWRCVIAR